MSAFSGRGKLGAMKLLMSNTVFQEVFTDLGKDWDVSEATMNVLEEFTCCLYVPKTEIKEVNTFRYQMFRTKKGNIQSSQLPPCQDCLKQHASRACYQAAVWHRSLEQKPHVPNPTNYVLNLDHNSRLSIKWMTGSAAPDAVLQFLSCKCKSQFVSCVIARVSKLG